MLNKTGKSKRGFTLIEVVTVLVILSVMALIAVPSLSAYLEHNEQTLRNSRAHTIYMAVQDALDSMSQSGLSASSAADGLVSLSALTPNPSEDELANEGNIAYLLFSKDSPDKETNPLYALLEERLSSELLAGTILIEYNVKTYNVLSVFYTDSLSYLGYSGSVEYNVSNRTEEGLENASVGYYGADYTGTPEEPVNVGDISVLIADYDGTETGNDINNGLNYGLLTVECTLPETLRADYIYRLVLRGQDGAEESLVLYGSSVPGELSIPDIISKGSLQAALLDPFSIGGRNLAMYVETGASGRLVLVVVLDSVYSGLTIDECFPTLSMGNVVAEFSVSGYGQVKSAASQVVHTHFAGRDASGVYLIKSVRHLNNIRYALSASYRQEKDIYVYNPYGQPYLFTPISGASGFSGSYTGRSGSQTYNLYDLSLKTTAAALFDRVEIGGTLSYLTLSYTSNYYAAYQAAPSGEKGDYYINGTTAAYLAATNRGVIENCSVFGRITGGTCGGIAATNSGTIRKCFAAVNITGNGTSGGMAAINTGTVSYCEVGTACGSSQLVGSPYFGSSLLAYSYPSATRNDSFEVNGVLSGGLVGENRSGGVLTYSVNAALVTSNTGRAGGLAGSNAGSITLSYNAGSVRGILNSGGLTALNTGSISECYNTALVNTTASAAGAFTGVVHSTAVSGGLVGSHTGGSVSNCYSISYGGSDLYGGAFGICSGTVTNCKFLYNTLNTSSKCRTSAGGAAADISGLAGASSATLRAATFGTLTSAGGLFSYPYPLASVNNASCTLGKNFHRTPYLAVVEYTPEKGRAYIVEQADGTMRLYFLFKDDAVDLLLTTNRGNMTVRITAANKQTLTRSPYTLVTGQGTIYAVANATNSEAYLAGYTHTFYINVDWPTSGSVLPHFELSSGSTTLTAYLYDYNTSGTPGATPYVTTNTVPEQQIILEKDANNYLTLRFFLPKDTNVTSSSMRLRYTSGLNQTIRLQPNDINNAMVTDDPADAIATTSKWLQFNTGAKRFPFYQKATSSRAGYDEYVILLTFAGSGNNGLNSGSFYSTFSYNGSDTYTSNTISR